jgi:hypothetical protein
MENSYEQAKAVKEAHESALMKKKNVVGVGVGLRQENGAYTDEVAIIVMVTHKVSADQLDPDDLIPAEIDGVPVDVQEVGEISAQ